MTDDTVRLVAYCGLYCGKCGRYRRGKCEGCLDGGGFSSCKVRASCIERGYRSCAECDEHLDCRILHSFISKVFGLIFRTNRKANLQAIREKGIEAWAEEMAATSRG